MAFIVVLIQWEVNPYYATCTKIQLQHIILKKIQGYIVKGVWGYLEAYDNCRPSHRIGHFTQK